MKSFITQNVILETGGTINTDFVKGKLALTYLTFGRFAHEGCSELGGKETNEWFN